MTHFDLLRRAYSQRFKNITVGISDKCNLRCPACRRPSPGKGYMTPPVFEAVLEVLDGEVEHAILSWKGEPTLSPYLPSIAEIADEYDVWTRMATNTCVPLEYGYVEKLLDALDVFKVSVDGYNQETLEHYRRGGSFDVLLRNLETIASIESPKAKKEMCVLMFKYNEGHEDEFRLLASEYGMDEIHWRKPIVNGHRVLTPPEAREWLPVNPKYHRYRYVDGVWVHRRCGFPKRSPSPVIDIEGTVYGCCSDRYMQAPLGNILRDDVGTIKRRLLGFWIDCFNRKYEFCKNYCWSFDGKMETIENVTAGDPGDRDA